MKVIYLCAFLCLFVPSIAGQKISVSGTVFDYNGAVVPGAKITAIADKSKAKSTATSKSEGEFRLDVEPGLYSIEANGDGFLSVKYPEFLIVNSASGMRLDFVMFASRYHEPCGYGGGNCLPAEMLIREFSVKYSPSLKQLIENFSDLNKKSKNK